jgi:hypothetical protein
MTLVMVIWKRSRVDEFGQWNLGDFERQSPFAEELRLIGQKRYAEIEAMKNEAPKYSQYGGNLKYQVKASGFSWLRRSMRKMVVVRP